MAIRLTVLLLANKIMWAYRHVVMSVKKSAR